MTSPPTGGPPADTAKDHARWEDRLLMAAMVGAAVVGIVGGIWAERWQHSRSASEPPRQLVDFALTDRTGRTITRQDLDQQFVVANCLFTSCSLSCRVVNDRMAEIQRLVADAPDVRLLSVSVDPRTDTPDVLAAFAATYHADTNRWLFLTGNKVDLYRFIKTSLCSASREAEGLIPGGFSGTDRLLVFDSRGTLRHSINGMKAGAAHEAVAAIADLRKKGIQP